MKLNEIDDDFYSYKNLRLTGYSKGEDMDDKGFEPDNQKYWKQIRKYSRHIKLIFKK